MDFKYLCGYRYIVSEVAQNSKLKLTFAVVADELDDDSGAANVYRLSLNLFYSSTFT